MFPHKSVLWLAVPLFALAGLSSCTKKEGCTDPNALNYDASAEKDCCCEYATTFDLELHLHGYVGANALLEGNTYTINGVDTRLDLVQFYVSNIRVVDASGTEFPAENYLLVKPEVNGYDAGAVEAGSYTALRFDIGIDSLTNHADPSVYPANDPLGPQFPPMHWSWDAGYIFIRIDGMADQDLNGTPETAFEMHVGKDANRVAVEIPYAFSAEAGDAFTFHLNVNWNNFFDGVDMTGDITTHTSDNLDLTSILVTNINGMFSLEE